jgi:hypothetical protein
MVVFQGLTLGYVFKDREDEKSESLLWANFLQTPTTSALLNFFKSTVNIEFSYEWIDFSQP